MLRWLRINRYRNVVPGTELTFSEGHHVLLGPNGGGKTTLLELIAAVLRGDFRDFSGEDFSFEYRISDGPDTLEVAISHLQRGATEPSDSDAWRDKIAAKLHIGGSSIKSINLDNGRITVDDHEVTGQYLGTKSIRLHRSLFSLCLSSNWYAPRLTDFTTDGAHRFDESLTFFSFLKGRGELDDSSFTFWARLDVSTPRKVTWAAFHSLFGTSSKTILASLNATDDFDRLTFPLSAFGSLGDVVDLLSFRSGVFRAELGRQERNDDGETLTYERFQFRFIRRDGTMVLDEHLSFGQKRLLAFLFYAWANDGPIVADELVDGMHYRWIEHCLKTIRGRQAFLSSQNPLLMDFIPIDSAEKVQQTFVICDVEERDGRERMRWRNLTADEAGEFFNAYEVGIQHVSEILRDKGLW